MRAARQARAAGILGVIGGLTWIAGISLEYSHHLQPPGSGTLFVVNQLMFLVAEACYLAVILGIIRIGAAGRGWFGRTATALFLMGQAALLVGLVLSFVIDRAMADVFLPIGGLLVLLGSLLTGVSVIRAASWHGWRRFVPLGYGLYYLLGLLVPLAVVGRDPTYLSEFLWSIAWSVLGLALFLEGRGRVERATTQRAACEAVMPDESAAQLSSC